MAFLENYWRYKFQLIPDPRNQHSKAPGL